MLSITKLQNLKAIHNLLRIVFERFWGCYQSQNYKIWKQLTTISRASSSFFSCYQSQNYKIWKQFTTGIGAFVLLAVVINHKTTKFESNSQLIFFLLFFLPSCYQSQNYKIWKQFTTVIDGVTILYGLLSIIKLQNLKAIHNTS